MKSKWIATSTIVGIWVIFIVLGVMAWQVAPALAGFTPPPVETQPPPVGTQPPTTRNGGTRGLMSPEMPVTGGQLSGPSNIVIAVLLLAAEIVLVFVAISLVIRQSARTKTKE